VTAELRKLVKEKLEKNVEVLDDLNKYLDGKVVL